MSYTCYFATTKNETETKNESLKSLSEHARVKKKRTLGIDIEDRRRHMYVLGKTGMGKSTLLQNMILQDIFAGLGVCFIDPHGDTVEYILDRIPKHRQNDLIYFNPSDLSYPIGLNALESDDDKHFLVASGLMSVFKRIWQGVWSARMEYILNNTLLTLIEREDTTLLGVIKLLTDTKYRNQLVSELKNPMVKLFWLKEFNNFNERYRQEAIAPILNKVGQFFSTSLMRNILGQSKSSFNLRQVMDGKKILLVNLSKGLLGSENSNLLGSLLVTQLQLAAMSRVNIPEKDRNDFYLYVDEFQNFTTDSFADILSEARKYHLNLILAHQYIGQLSETGNDKVKGSVFGNIGTILAFQLGFKDAQFLKQEFSPINPEELLSLGKTELAVKLSQNFKNNIPVIATSLPPIFARLGIGNSAEAIKISRLKYGRGRKVVEKEIRNYLLG